MYELELTWRRVLSVWWLMTWRGIVAAIVLALVTFVNLRIAGDRSADEFAPISMLFSAFWVVFSVACPIFVTRSALTKHYSDFCLMPVTSIPPRMPSPQSTDQT
jgi:hypothetical protein